jgi:hypothetical protein
MNSAILLKAFACDGDVCVVEWPNGSDAMEMHGWLVYEIRNVTYTTLYSML